MIDLRDFNAEAASWDESPQRRAVAEAVVGGILAYGGLRSTDRLLDVGCGTGLATLPLAKRVRSVTAIDPAQGMIERLRGKLYAEGLNNVRCLCTAFETLDEPEEPFDLVICTQTLSHVESPEDFLARMPRFLRPGGRVFVSEMEMVSGAVVTGGRSRLALAALLQGAGLKTLSAWNVLDIPRGKASDPLLARYYVLAAVLA